MKMPSVETEGPLTSTEVLVDEHNQQSQCPVIPLDPKSKYSLLSKSEQFISIHWNKVAQHHLTSLKSSFILKPR